MRTQTDVDGGKYCDLMEEIKRRIEVVTYFLSGGGHALYQPATLESACLQIRKILELVAFGSLVANKEVYTTVYRKISKAWNASDILQELKKVNPNFYPVPVIELPSGIPGVATRHQKRVGDYLDEEEFEEVYGRCGVMAHAANPYRKGIDYGYYARMLPKWRTRILHLLNSHNIQLVGEPGIYLIHMSEHGDDRVKFYKFQPPTDEALRKLGLKPCAMKSVASSCPTNKGRLAQPVLTTAWDAPHLAVSHVGRVPRGEISRPGSMAEMPCGPMVGWSD